MGLEMGPLFVTAFVVGLSGAASPGPLTTVAVREASRGGFWRGWSVTLGHAIPEALLVAALALGLGRLFEEPGIVAALAAVGGGVLIWMGVSTIGAARTATLPRAGDDRGTAGCAVWAGVAATVSNPYWFLWWATVGAGYVALSQGGGWQGMLVFFLGHIMADVGWLGFVAALVSSGRRWAGDGAYRGLLAVLGTFLLGFGAYFLLTAWRFLGEGAAGVF